MNKRGAAGAALAVLGAVAVGIPSAGAPAAPAPVSPAGADLVSVALAAPDQLSMALRTADRRVHDPAAVTLPGSAGVTGAVPAAATYAFLGEPGRTVWALAPQGADLPAWDTTGVAPGLLAAESVTLELVEVAGPGAFHAYQLSPVGQPELLFGSPDAAPRRAALPAGARRGGAVWVFDTAGTHQVTLAASARLATGGTATDQATYQVEVPELPAAAPELAVARQAEAAPPPAAGPPARQAPEQVLNQVPEQPAGEDSVVIDDGHIDIGPRIVDGTWTLQMRDDTVSPEVWRDLHDVVLHAVDEAIVEVPPEFDFLGDPGDEVWLLPQAQQAGIVWPGWNTQHESVVSDLSGDTTWTLQEVTGPGEFVLYLNVSFGEPEILFTTGESLPQEMTVPANTHAHGNWVFTEPGVYHLTLEVSGTLAGGEQVSDSRVVAFAVGDQTDPGTAFPPAGNGSGNGDGNDDDGGNGGDNGGVLGQTGLRLVALLGGGAALLAAGVVLVLLTIRRRRAPVSS